MSWGALCIGGASTYAVIHELRGVVPSYMTVVVGAGLVGLTALGIWRGQLVSLTTNGEELLIVNFWSTRRVQWPTVERLEFGWRSMLMNREPVLIVHTTNGDLRASGVSRRGSDQDEVLRRLATFAPASVELVPSKQL